MNSVAPPNTALLPVWAYVGGGAWKPASFALVDSCDYERLAGHRWCFLKPGMDYVGRYPDDNVRRRPIWLHHEVLGVRLTQGSVVDHINRVPLDNRRNNLQQITQAQNKQNRGSDRDSISKHRGVSFRKGSLRNPWQVHVRVNGRSKSFGVFATEAAAAIAAAEARAIHMPYSAEGMARTMEAKSR